MFVHFNCERQIEKQNPGNHISFKLSKFWSKSKTSSKMCQSKATLIKQHCWSLPVTSSALPPPPLKSLLDRGVAALYERGACLNVGVVCGYWGICSLSSPRSFALRLLNSLLPCKVTPGTGGVMGSPLRPSYWWRGSLPFSKETHLSHKHCYSFFEKHILRPLMWSCLKWDN